ncbi:poly [ADP-ribose] polymerase [Elysia marginata]|uniref:Poly [ADP-ribose] polymerase n=1 Tax=Elysia marginata TaxID=1093978 RepID=A0AAV4G685_9GAST|nr:poly [ADP-ribose] polymerase [Elysia marginata]
MSCKKGPLPDTLILQSLAIGSQGVPKGVMSRLTTPEMFFTYLREQMMISRDNLLLLQAFLWHLQRKDLHELAAEYARRIGNTLYFYAPQEQPEDGFKHIQFHVEGNLDRFQRSDLEALRATMARLLFVPQEFIFLSGVEPSNSLTLTFMIHEQYVDPLKDLFKEHSDSFGKLGVDGISVNDSEYIDPTLAVRRRASAPASGATQEQLRALYERSRRLENQVAQSEIRSLEAQADATLARKESLEWQRKEHYFRSMVSRIVEDPREPAPVDEKCLSLI